MYDTLILIILVVLILFIVNHKYANNKRQNPWLIFKNERINQLFKISQKSLIENDLLKAEKSLLTILNLDPYNAMAYNRIGIIYAKQNEYQDAVECFKAAYSLQQNVNSIHNLGLAYYNLDKFDQAALALKQAIELDGRSAIRYVEYAKVLERLNQTDEVIEALEKAKQLEAKPEILKILIKIYKTHNMEDKAQALEIQLNQTIKSLSQSDHLNRPSTRIT